MISLSLCPYLYFLHYTIFASKVTLLILRISLWYKFGRCTALKSENGNWSKTLPFSVFFFLYEKKRKRKKSLSLFSHFFFLITHLPFIFHSIRTSHFSTRIKTVDLIQDTLLFVHNTILSCHIHSSLLLNGKKILLLLLLFLNFDTLSFFHFLYQNHMYTSIFFSLCHFLVLNFHLRLLIFSLTFTL